MSLFRALHPFALLMLACVGCSAGTAEPAGALDASADDAADADPPCPESMPKGACSAAGQTCLYDKVPYDKYEYENRCDCVAPEMQWQCCNYNQLFTCAGGPRMFPVGSLCCPGDVNAPPEESFGCSFCYPDDHELVFMCSPDDRHWRETTDSCTYVPPTCPDGGLADLDAANPCQAGDDGGSDAAQADGSSDAAADAGASDAAGQ